MVRVSLVPLTAATSKDYCTVQLNRIYIRSNDQSTVQLNGKYEIEQRKRVTSRSTAFKKTYNKTRTLLLLDTHTHSSQTQRHSHTAAKNSTSMFSNKKHQYRWGHLKEYCERLLFFRSSAITITRIITTSELLSVYKIIIWEIKRKQNETSKEQLQKYRTTAENKRRNENKKK